MADLLQFPPMVSSYSDPLPTDTLSLSDPEARAAALDIQRSWIVEAPAGSGKTALLIQRYLKLLAQGQVYRPADVLVLTFTRKADGELRDRVLHQLKAAQANTPLEPGAPAFEHEIRVAAHEVLARDRALGWRLLDFPTQLNIRTIDSFCAELAASTPLLAGGSARRPPVEDAFPLYRAAAERTLAALGGPDAPLSDALEHLLLHRDAQVQDCLALIASMLAQREQWGELLPLRPTELADEHLDQVVRPRLERTLARIVAGGLTRAAEALGPEDLVELASFACGLSSRPGYKDRSNPLACCSDISFSLPSEANNHPIYLALIGLLLKGDDGWRKRLTAHDLSLELSKEEQTWLQNFIEHLKHRENGNPYLRESLAAVRGLPPAKYPDEQWPTIKALSRVLARALVELQGVFAQRSQSDFTEIALAARALLRPDPGTGPLASDTHDPLDTPAARLSHLLVDEMQDTSAGQYELLESLTSSWDGASQTVFLVGDPKQSIYAFRQARVERFLRTLEAGRFGDLPLGGLRLTANFRSQAALVAAFNEAFVQIFPSPAELTDASTTSSPRDEVSRVPFVAATAARPSSPGPALHWHGYVKPDALQPPTPAVPAQSEAQEIRGVVEAFLRDWRTRPCTQGLDPRPPKIAILARNRAHLAPILAELRGREGQGPIPFRAVDVEALNERPEVLDLLALTRALLHPADRVAWLAVLRSPLCGLTRADLLALTGEGPTAEPTATVAHLLATRHHELSPSGQLLLQRVWPTLQEALRAVGRTCFSTHVERTWRSLGGDAPLTRDQHSNALRYLNLLARLEAGQEPLTLPLLEQNLKRLYAQPFAGEAAVELMTIHKAKGLEWDLVLVPSLERGSGRNPHGLLKWLELDNPLSEADFLLAPIQARGEEASALSSWLAESERRRAVAEAQRLFYVACTRAREELHLFATVERGRGGSLCTPRNGDSLLKAAWPVAEAILDQQLSPSTEPGTLVTFPAAPQPLSLAASAEETVRPPGRSRPAPTTQRLPSSFEPRARFQRENGPNLAYAPASQLPRVAAFTRPEGSFAARAFGNAVHRYLQLLATRLAAAPSAQLQAELPAWLPRLTATLRNEGLPPALAASEAQRALSAIRSTLDDPEGAWLLAPHGQARNEASLGSQALRADRTFFAGPTPLRDSGEATHLWIVDYKTAELGGRSSETFLADQKIKYMPQMQMYAQAAAAAGSAPEKMVLALYFPLLPALLHWPATELLVQQ